MLKLFVEPDYKKSFNEHTMFRRKLEENSYVSIEFVVNWRWGSGWIEVPETEEELKEWVDRFGDNFGYTYEDIPDFTIENFLPEPGEECVELDGYDFDLNEAWDGCAEDWYVYGPSSMTEEEKEELLEEVQEAYQEDYDEGVSALPNTEWFSWWCSIDTGIVIKRESEDGEEIKSLSELNWKNPLKKEN
jgi:hypothetical protein